jgi:DNA gyrase subunit A
MEVGLVRRVDIDQEMQQSYLDYAMSVIVARALPDARDGLKPVQRRILYAMQDLNLTPDSAYKKSARVVGEVLGKYHPHGDVAVYEAMARLAQDFSMRYPLVDGQGNFGSIDGDPPAAMRYTEARLTRFAMELMAQIERNTVDFLDNFDGTLQEPEVLPAAVPNLLVNGASGIAVGMATSIPPHNLSEVVDALIHMIERWEHLDDLAVSDLMLFIKGPDFPTGGIILQEGGDSGLLSAYGSGKGRITVRGRVHAEELGRGRSRLIITELPYQTNKTSLIERIAELVRDGSLEGIADLRDESDRQGMRIVIELKQGIEVDEILRALYQRTPLQTTFGITLLALVDGEPRLLNLKQALRVFLEHRITVVKRRSEYDLAKAKARAHILEGLRVALKNLDEIISLIRNSPDVEQARERLIKRYKLTEIQAQAILDMQLRRLASLERKKIEDEYKEVTALIKSLESLLHSPKKIREVVAQELAGMKATYGDRRRTQIVSLQEGTSVKSVLTTTDMTPAQTVWVCVTWDGKIGRTIGDTPPKPAPRYLIKASTHATLCLTSTQGQASAVAVHALPEIENLEGGVELYKASALAPEDRLVSIFTVPEKVDDASESFIFSISRQGLVKKSSVSELPGPSAQRFTLVKINDEDELLATLVTQGDAEIGLITAQGMGIRFSEDEVRPMGLVAAGVMGIKLAEGDAVAAGLKWDAKAELVIAASDGAAWRIAAGEFPLQGRYGQGVIACRVGRNAEIVGAVIGGRGAAAALHFQKGSSRTLKFSDVSLVKRSGKSTRVATIKSGDEVDGLSPADASDAGAREPVARKRSIPQDNGGAPAVKPVAEAKASPAGKKAAPTRAVKKTAAPVKSRETPSTAGKKTAAKPAASKKTTHAVVKKQATARAGVTATKQTPAAKKGMEKKAVPTPPAVEQTSAAEKKTTGKKPPAVAEQAKAGKGEKPAAKKTVTKKAESPATKPKPAASVTPAEKKPARKPASSPAAPPIKPEAKPSNAGAKGKQKGATTGAEQGLLPGLDSPEKKKKPTPKAK